MNLHSAMHVAAFISAVDDIAYLSFDLNYNILYLYSINSICLHCGSRFMPRTSP